MKFHDKYRISTTRLSMWDYSRVGAYFVTICIRNKQHYFGKIDTNVDSTKSIALLQPTEIGKKVIEEWYKTPSIREDMNIELLDFVLMPNHLHGIIFIKENQYNVRSDAMPRVLPSEKDVVNHFGSQSKNVASIIRGYKSSITMYARKNNIHFGWQPRYYVHIIRNEQDLRRIQEYIQNNPARWMYDELYSV